MSDSFTGEIRSFAFKFAPQDWAFCDGALLNISQYQMLYAIINTVFGGDGRNTFAIPNLTQRAIAHPNMTANGAVVDITLGQYGGSNSVTVNVNELPAHTHTLHRQNVPGDFTNKSSAPSTSSYLSSYTYRSGSGPYTYTQLTALEKDGLPNTVINPATIGNTGGTQAHENRQPYLPLNMCICFNGAWPSRP
ncbi:phage tail protein [Pokkaliibacter plantistimulans]|uniref:phage tail protein n=1 Tax=Pokkaliibacter plantistimulans TaxID=1635171 RepID=UPI000D7491D7|nr:tail fiber protein [Pokkaliibacter plantistimulans]